MEKLPSVDKAGSLRSIYDVKPDWSMQSRRACVLTLLWLCAWLAPILHQTQCAGHHHGDTACPVCQLATTSVLAAPPQVAPVPVRALTHQLPVVWASFHALLFQVEHPPRGPPPVVSV